MGVNPVPPRGGPREPMEPEFGYPPSDDPRTNMDPAGGRKAPGRKFRVPLPILLVLIAAAIIVALIVFA